MMMYSKMKQSCEIFEKYNLGKDYFEADHDIIYGPDLDEDFSEEDINELETLGWFKSDEYDCWCTFC